MRIDSSVIGMESARSYKKTSATVSRFVIRDYQQELTQGNNALHAAIGENTENAYETESSSNRSSKQENLAEAAQTANLQDWQSRLHVRISNAPVRSEEDRVVMDIRQATVRYIFDLLFRLRREALYGRERLREEMGSENMGVDTARETEFGTINQVANGSQSGMQSLTANLRILSYQQETIETEIEETSFSTVGTVRTADGREINFNVNVGMSRAFQQQYSEQVNWTAFRLCDPLVINLDTDVAELSDQTFYFDIDADGEEDEVSQLSDGSGYLALDKNGDGKVNDGSELFGTTSGNGFADLAKYDEDGNGWIDEADEIFQDLTIWTLNEEGEKVQISLKDADVGAIYLGKASTEYSLQNEETHETNGIIRSTGIYLKESGGVGTVQLIDLAI